MTQQDKIKELIELLADKTLSFGCRVTTETQDEPFIFVRATRTRRSPFRGGLQRDYHCYFDRTSPVIREEDAIVIGHPITLARVLLKIAEKNSFSFNMAYPLPLIRIGNYEMNVPWNLEKDDLTQQSPETIEFIYKLFKND